MPDNDIKKDEKKAAEEYTVQEVLDELMADMSWEENPMYRNRVMGFIMTELFTAS